MLVCFFENRSTDSLRLLVVGKLALGTGHTRPTLRPLSVSCQCTLECIERDATGGLLRRARRLTDARLATEAATLLLLVLGGWRAGTRVCGRTRRRTNNAVGAGQLVRRLRLEPSAVTFAGDRAKRRRSRHGRGDDRRLVRGRCDLATVRWLVNDEAEAARFRVPLGGDT